MPTPPRPRRAVLGSTLLFLAGCLGDTGDDTADDTAATRAGREIGDVELSNAFPIVMTDVGSGDRVTDIHDHGDWSHWHQQPVTVPLGDSVTVVVEVYDADDRRIDVGDSGALSLSIVIESGSAFLDLSLDTDELTLTGNDVGEGELAVTLSADGDDWTPPPLAFEVVDPAAGDDD